MCVWWCSTQYSCKSLFFFFFFLFKDNHKKVAKNMQTGQRNKKKKKRKIIFAVHNHHIVITSKSSIKFVWYAKFMLYMIHWRMRTSIDYNKLLCCLNILMSVIRTASFNRYFLPTFFFFFFYSRLISLCNVRSALKDTTSQHVVHWFARSNNDNNIMTIIMMMLLYFSCIRNYLL